MFFLVSEFLWFTLQIPGELTGLNKESFSLPRLRWMTWTSTGGIKELLNLTLADIGFRSGSALFDVSWEATSFPSSSVIAEIQVSYLFFSISCLFFLVLMFVFFFPSFSPSEYSQC